MNNNPELPPLVALVGCTAAGKTELGITLAERLGGEIVGADSRQVYRYMDIGTDKPTPAARKGVPHHLIELVDPDEPYTLALYQADAYRAIEEIGARGNVPVIAGGTPLYLNAVLEGWTVPRVEPDHALRAQLEQEAAQVGPAALHARLEALDPKAAEGILPTNTRRIVRALEVISLTGQPISSQQRKEPPPYRTLIIGLTLPQEQLYARIDARVDAQIGRGLVDEVSSLHARGYSFALPSMSGLGYRQIGEYLQGRATLAEAVQRIKWDTHNFARRQRNWFRRMTSAHWLDVSHADPLSAASALALDLPVRNGA